MSADETNLFFDHSNILKLFSTVNAKLANINQCFNSNKLSLNAKKQNILFFFFHKPSRKDDIPLMLPKLTISDHVIEKQGFIEFLGVLLDENLNRKEHIKYSENKIVKDLEIWKSRVEKPT